MNKTKRKGFTLVELLAVIVILAVVILIAVTAVVPRMNNAKKKAFIDEGLVYMKAAQEMALSGAVQDGTTECFNISDLGNYVKQSKDGYSGTLYINGGGITLNLTNGKYYLIKKNNSLIDNLSETKQSNFISTCSEEKQYTITYELDGGNVSGTNPSTYKTNVGTNEFINPTKSGYRFVGWSSKNEFDKSKYLSMNDFTYNSSSSSMVKYAKIQLKPNTEYKVSVTRYNGYNGIPKNGWLIISILNSDGWFNTNNTWSPIGHTTPNSSQTGWSYTTGSDGLLYIGRYNFTQEYLDEVWLNTDVQIERGSTPTDYQEYMEPTRTAKIYRGSTGNKKFIANWEPL